MVFVNFFRTGGFKSWEWERTQPVQGRAMADAQRAEIVRQGYECFTVTKATADEYGTPTAHNPAEYWQEVAEKIRARAEYQIEGVRH